MPLASVSLGLGFRVILTDARAFAVLAEAQMLCSARAEKSVSITLTFASALSVDSVRTQCGRCPCPACSARHREIHAHLRGCASAAPRTAWQLATAGAGCGATGWFPSWSVSAGRDTESAEGRLEGTVRGAGSTWCRGVQRLMTDPDRSFWTAAGV